MVLFVGTAIADSLSGSSGNDTLLGLQGNDTLVGFGGSDLLSGGQGSDSISYGTVVGAAGYGGSSLIYGGEGSDTIVSAGSSGNNTIVGGTGNASIDAGSDGGDYIDATADTGNDLILGNYGDDTIFGTSVAAAGGIGTIGQGSAGVQDILVGGFGNDIIIDFSSTSSIILGQAGNDSIGLNFFSDSLTAGSDTVYGGQGDDFIITESPSPRIGNDLVVGGEGSDTIAVVGGNYSILGGTGIASIDAAQDGNDLIFLFSASTYGAGNDLILGNYGDDTIIALGETVNSAGDTLVGGYGNDVISASGAQSNDAIFGNQNNDVIIVASVTGGSGNDLLVGGTGDDSITFQGSASQGDVVYGNEGNNFISVYGAGNDTIFGGNSSADGAGNGDGTNFIDVSGVTSAAGATSVTDVIYGGSGNDVVNVGTSTAVFSITGGAGNDVFRFVDSVSGVGAGSGNDVITDFASGQDRFAINTNVTATSGDFIPNSVQNFGTSVQGGTLYQAANSAIVGAASVGGANAATFKFGSDFYLVADVNNSGTFNTGDVLVDIRTTSSLTKNDFV